MQPLKDETFAIVWLMHIISFIDLKATLPKNGRPKKGLVWKAVK